MQLSALKAPAAVTSGLLNRSAWKPSFDSGGAADEAAPKGFEIMSKFTAPHLKGKSCEPLFPYFAHLEEQGAIKVVNDGYVTADSGVGIVHRAPAFGEDDYRVCLANGVSAKGEGIPCPLDEGGRFVDPVTDFAGMYCKGRNNYIKQLLDESVGPWNGRNNQPVLIGTGSVTETRAVASMVAGWASESDPLSINVNVLIADQERARCVAGTNAQAGNRRSVTNATHLAAGGATNILLGGTPKGLVQTPGQDTHAVFGRMRSSSHCARGTRGSTRIAASSVSGNGGQQANEPLSPPEEVDEEAVLASLLELEKAGMLKWATCAMYVKAKEAEMESMLKMQKTALVSLAVAFYIAVAWAAIWRVETYAAQLAAAVLSAAASTSGSAAGQQAAPAVHAVLSEAGLPGAAALARQLAALAIVGKAVLIGVFANQLRRVVQAALDWTGATAKIAQLWNALTPDAVAEWEEMQRPST